MTLQWKKEKQSDLAKPGFSLAYAHYLTLIFHTLCRGGVLLSGVRTSENQITPGAHLYMTVHHQWTNSVLCVQVHVLCTMHGIHPAEDTGACGGGRQQLVPGHW
jgi:hypothetical protein